MVRFLNKKAYIDPGTTISIVGGSVPIVTAVFAAVSAFLVKFFWKPIKNGVKSVCSKVSSKK